MREIEQPETNADAKLARALRSLSACSSEGIRPEIGEQLARRFRRHHARRRAIRATALLVFVAFVFAGVVLMSKPHRDQPVVQKAPQVAPKQQESATQRSKPAKVHVVASSKNHQRGVRPAAQHNVAAKREEFLPLPAYSPTVRLEDTSVVRVELPTSTLRLVGAPVSPQAPSRRVVADFVVGQDGTPYAVRLVAVRGTE